MSDNLKSFGSAYAKINISLDIIKKMPDGYHEMKMIMQSIDLCDDITIECSPGSGISVSTDLPYLPADERNIAAKAAATFFAYTKITGYSTRITIKKKIPVCAGLGGGSSDGACVLKLLDGIFNTQIKRDVLMEVGGKIGSDIPFCIMGGTALATGRGNLLSPLPPFPDCFIVICKPPFAFSTPDLFSKIKCDKIRARPDTDGIITALHNKDINAIARRMYNVFEDALPRNSRDIGDIKSRLLDFGALGAVMTGSGSAVFALFSDEGEAKHAYKVMSEDYKECYFTKCVRNV